MSEIWLKINRRATLFAAVPPASLVLVAVALLVLAWENIWIRAAGLVLGSIGLILLLVIAVQARLPRLAYRDGLLLVYLRATGPVEVPIDLVEAFFLGQGPTLLPGPRHQLLKTSNLVIRLAERADDYAQRDVKPALGCWAEGYITIRGTWCEPLSVDVAHRLNRKLADAKRALRAQHEQDHATT